MKIVRIVLFALTLVGAILIGYASFGYNANISEEEINIVQTLVINASQFFIALFLALCLPLICIVLKNVKLKVALSALSCVLPLAYITEVMSAFSIFYNDNYEYVEIYASTFILLIGSCIIVLMMFLNIIFTFFDKNNAN